MNIEAGFQIFSSLVNGLSIEGVLPLVFKDGPKPKDVIELFGEEGTGKSEILLNVVAGTILPKSWKSIPLNGKDGHIIYIDNDYKFSLIRLITLMESRIFRRLQEHHAGEDVIDDVENLITECLCNLTLIRCTSSSELLTSLYSLELNLQGNPNIPAIMIDSISAFYWIDKCNGGDSLAAQERNMVQITEVLSKMINRFGLIVFATKCALLKKRDHKFEHSTSNTEGLKVDHQQFLCKSWEHLVTKRFLLEKQGLSNNIKCHTHTGSSKYYRSFIELRITENGIQKNSMHEN